LRETTYQEDVDTKVSTTSSLEENTERGEENGEDDLADVRTGKSHCKRL